MKRSFTIAILVFALLAPQGIFASPAEYIGEKANECKEMISFISNNNLDFSQTNEETLGIMAQMLICNKPEITKKLSQSEISMKETLSYKIETAINNLPPKESELFGLLKGMVEGEWREETWVELTEQKTKELDTTLKAIWNKMALALQQQQIEKAMTFFEDSAQQIYRKQYTALAPALGEIAAEFLAAELLFVDVDSRTATYEVLTTREGTKYSFNLYFVKDANNHWKIYRF